VDALGQFDVGGAAVALQFGQDPAVDYVQIIDMHDCCLIL
jgi:hypothetical protein